MSTVSQIRDRLMGVFSEKQADVLAHVVFEAHDDLGARSDFIALTDVVKDLAEAQKRTEIRVEELAEAQKRTEARVGDLAEAQKRTEARVGDLAEAQKRTETRVGDLAEAQKRTETRVEDLAEAQKRTETRVEELAEAQKRTEARVGDLAEAQKGTETQVKSLAEAIIDLTETQKKMLLCIDDHDGRSLEYVLVRRLPSYVGVEFRKCRVIDNADLIDALETRVSEAELKDILRTDIIATAKLEEQSVHLVVEVSCTGHSSDVQRAARRAAALTAAGFPAIAMVACKKIASPAAVKAKEAGVRLLVGAKLRPEAA